MEQEKLELLLKESKKRTFLTRIMACCMIIITVAMLVTVSVLVPKAIESMKHLNDAAVTFDNAVTEMHELTVELKDTNMLLQNFVNDNAIRSNNIANGTIESNEEKTFNLRLWIDINATIEQTAEKVFESKVVIISTLNKHPYK